MFIYNYPDPNKETKIIVQNVDNEIITCEWWPDIKQWVDARKPITRSTISYLEFDCRISNGSVQWCYMSELQNFINRNQKLKIKEEI